MRNLFFTFFLLVSSLSFAQELLAQVKVDYSQIQGSNTTAFTSLESSLRDFINTTKWTDKNYKINERIECNFTLVINSKEGSNEYKASLLVQSRRPVFGSSYYTPTLNINDKKFSFKYTPYEQLIFNERKFSQKNLTDVIGFYVYLILGYDADTFQSLGGTTHFKKCQLIANNAVNSDFEGWSELEGVRARLPLINKILSSQNNTLRKIYYEYDLRGLDKMGSNQLNAKNTIANALLKLKYYEQINDYAQNYPLDLFFQAKKEEIVQIFSGGLPTKLSLSKLKQLFSTLSPTNSTEWNKLSK